MAQITPLLQLTKPTVGGAETNNVWGNDLNRNFDKLDIALGPLPARVTALEKGGGAVGPPGPAGPPGEDGATGPAGPPGGATIHISDTPPPSPVAGQLWWESDTGLLAVSYDDGSSTQWVAVGEEGPPGPAGAPGAAGPPGPAGSSGTVSDGDKGDIIVSGSGASMMLDSAVVTPAAKTVLDDTTTAAMLATLGAVAKAGDTMTGTLVLAADPVNDLDAATQHYVDAALGGGAIGFFDYTFNGSAYVPPPAAGNFRMNNVDQTLATTIYFHEQTAPGNDATLMWGQIAVGSTLLVQAKATGTRWQKYIITSIVDSGAYFTVGVTWQAGGSPLTNARSGVIIRPPVTLLEAPTDGKAYKRRGSTGAWVTDTISTSAPSGGADGDIWYQVP